ncbi:MAG: CCC motif membrane protein [Flavobacteriaceae bacterium]|jgi:hypothetical protein|nr:DUF4190 domain-containing protein [Flavobacteriaceae bacterium]
MEKHKLPHAQSALILGIVSIVTACCCYGLPGLIIGFIGINEAKKAQKTYNENPEMYTGLGNANTGRITSIIGIAFGALAVIYYIYLISSGKWGETMDQYKQILEQYQNQ